VTTFIARRRRVVALVLAALGLGIDLAAVVVLGLEAARAALPPVDGNTAGGYVLAATFPVVGWIIATRRSDNVIGWIFLVIGLSQATSTFANVYATFGIATGSTAPPLAAEMAWLGSWSWAPGFILLLTLSVLLFPDGDPPSPRWRPVIWATGVALVLVVVPTALAAWPIRSAALATAPFGPGDAASSVASALQGVGLLVAAIAAAASVAGLVVRFRRSHGVERRQLQWFTWAGAAEITVLAVTPFLNFGSASGLVNVVAAIVIAPLLPVAAAVGILRYHLYDIDRIVSRTISYALVTATLAALFVVVVLLTQDLLAPLTHSNGVAVAASTLLVASLFQPLRRRVQRATDRRFNRTRYDAEREIEAFTVRVRDFVDVEPVVNALEHTLHRTIEPAHAALWLRSGAR